MANAAYYIQALDMLPHPEGGFYKEIYKHPAQIIHPEMNNQEHAFRHLSTTIYYLLSSGEVSRFHQLRSDEIWFYHAGGPLRIHTFRDGNYQELVLGLDISSGQLPQQLIEAGTIFGAEPIHGESYTFVSCMVSPGFDMADFSFCQLSDLTEMAPDYELLFRRMTKI